MHLLRWGFKKLVHEFNIMQLVDSRTPLFNMVVEHYTTCLIVELCVSWVFSVTHLARSCGTHHIACKPSIMKLASHYIHVAHEWFHIHVRASVYFDSTFDRWHLVVEKNLRLRSLCLTNLNPFSTNLVFVVCLLHVCIMLISCLFSFHCHIYVLLCHVFSSCLLCIFQHVCLCMLSCYISYMCVCSFVLMLSCHGILDPRGLHTPPRSFFILSLQHLYN